MTPSSKQGAGPDPFDNLGKPVPPERRSNALAHVRDMVPGVKTGDATPGAVMS